MSTLLCYATLYHTIRHDTTLSHYSAALNALILVQVDTPVAEELAAAPGLGGRFPSEA